MATVEDNNGFDAQVLAPDERSLVLDMSLTEAAALRAWLLKPAADGSTALDDSDVNAVMKKLSSALDKLEAVEEIRRELEEAGLPTEGMSDEALADLGRKIGQASSRVR